MNYIIHYGWRTNATRRLRSTGYLPLKTSGVEKQLDYKEADICNGNLLVFCHSYTVASEEFL